VSWQRAAPTLLVLMLLAALGDLLVSCDGTIPSHRLSDATKYFAFLRDFGYSELRRGNLPLWNPHLYSGTPFVGVFQSAMFYPPNLAHLFLPVPLGINFEFAFHLLLLSLGTLAWARGRGLSAPAALATASVAVFGASVSLRVLAGALSVLATCAWAPLLLHCVDRLSRQPTLGWTLVAGLAAAMTLLAGHLPTAFMSAVAVSLYCVPALLASPARGRFAGSLAAAGLLALLLAGAQLGAGFEVARESVREGGVPFDYATTYSLPPESLLTAAVPYLFGSATDHGMTYFGRWWYWDDSAFVGVTALALATLGALRSRGRGRGVALALALALLVLALGRHTPVYAVLYRWVPGFDLLRAPSKFLFFASLFVGLLAGLGMDRLLAEDAGGGGPPTGGAGGGGPPPGRRRVALVLAALGALAVGAGVWTSRVAAGEAGGPSLVHALAALNEARSFRPEELTAWGEVAGPSLRRAGLTSLLLAALFWASRTRRAATWAILALCLLDLFWFARENRGGIAYDWMVRNRPAAVKLYASAGERRVLELLQADNLALAVRGHALWGYDPVVLARYAEFVAHTQGRSRGDLDNVRGRHPSWFHPLFGMLRGHFSLAPSFGAYVAVTEHPGELPRFVLVGSYALRQGAEAVLRAMDDPAFDPRALALLESEPEPRPAGGPVRGEVALLEESTDAMSLDVRVEAPALLVVTDSYARGWRAVALPGSVQQAYRVQPANLVLRAIALGAGRHRLRLEYAPAAYRVGQAASLLGVVVALAGGALWWRRRARVAP
jgi:hypothetical protein